MKYGYGDPRVSSSPQHRFKFERLLIQQREAQRQAEYLLADLRALEPVIAAPGGEGGAIP